MGVIVVALHVAVARFLMGPFAFPDFPDCILVQRPIRTITFDVPLTRPTPHKHPGGGHSANSLQPSQPLDAPPITLTAQPLISAGGDGVTSDAGATGAGTGKGTGNGAGQGAEKLSGEIRASDYPEASRPLRIGDYVIVALTVGTDGRVQSCRIHRPSRDTQADAITCSLARERFRFRPATDAAGHAVEAEFGWRQSWHY